MALQTPVGNGEGESMIFIFTWPGHTISFARNCFALHLLFCASPTSNRVDDFVGIRKLHLLHVFQQVDLISPKINLLDFTQITLFYRNSKRSDLVFVQNNIIHR
jgi:hypothetical protein